MKKLYVEDMNHGMMGHPQRPMPRIMIPEMMKRLLGGRFPNTGFSWDIVHHFKLECGVWEPCDESGEILPAIGFRVKVTCVPM